MNLPSISELTLLADVQGIPKTGSYYWSSDKYNSGHARAYDLTNKKTWNSAEKNLHQFDVLCISK